MTAPTFKRVGKGEVAKRGPSFVVTQKALVIQQGGGEGRPPERIGSVQKGKERSPSGRGRKEKKKENFADPDNGGVVPSKERKEKCKKG